MAKSLEEKEAERIAKEKAKEEKKAEKDAAAIAKAEAKIGTASVDVLDVGGNFVRTYSVKLHGEDFVQLAEMYSKKIKGSVRKSG